MPWEVAVHEHPAWRDQSNFIIGAKIEHGRREQLWARQVGENRFLLCCIPFFAYDLALGDEVETAPSDGRQYIVQRVSKPSGHYTFRVWFGRSTHEHIREEVKKRVAIMGCAMEWFSPNLAAIDASTQTIAREVADYLEALHDTNGLIYETGLTHERPSLMPPDDT